ncbi:GerW family sporulation protein [Natranaerofaba carboxydovora]|uniref:GerW family sporulation protein n=1 Tax=Natranaerofaba carboxydovora TaxID=2742683 RepID=UPI001F142873|nr:spore germination protein GerW family protein [Natranaerofaba carboxydovora]UMZ74382.1 Sporulation protein YtfJ (Spore_YtfJ) [Natranaerofaba carboxydovora]
MSSGNQLFNNLLEKLEKFVRTETVVGEPIVVGNVTMVPIVSVSLGLGGGEGTGKDDKGNDGTGTGGGAGCKITPNAILVIKDGEFSVFPLTSKGSAERLVDMVPEIIQKVESYKTKQRNQSQESDE